jgi:hypothetical protein
MGEAKRRKLAGDAWAAASDDADMPEWGGRSTARVTRQRDLPSEGDPGARNRGYIGLPTPRARRRAVALIPIARRRAPVIA